ncbi:hypothetical protein AB4505_07905 [Vibrio splendidus]
MIKRILSALLLLQTYNVSADTLEDVVCHLREDTPTCEFEDKKQYIKITLDSNIKQPQHVAPVINVEPIVNVEPILKVQSNPSVSFRDKVSLFLAIIGLSGFGLNSWVFFTQARNRKADKESDLFNFWLKEIIYPIHIEPLLKEISIIENLYDKWVNASEDEEASAKSGFMDEWPKKKIELLQNIPSNSSLPYLSSMFTNLRQSVLKIDDYVLNLAYSDSDQIFVVEGAEIPLENVEVEEERPKAELFSDLAQFVYKSIQEQQTKPLPPKRMRLFKLASS